MNILFCVGCDQYVFLNPLQGAEHDAREMFETLCRSGFYDEGRSKLLLSPTTTEMAMALSTCLRGDKIAIFTFFFAGHAGGKSGSFFLTLRESEEPALSATAFPLSRLFEMINEFQPRQVNVIIDGCEAGSSTASVRTLLRPEDIGTVRASSISFLGACAADQFAGESEKGGLLTTHLLQVLRGESDLVLHKPLLELADLAAHVSDAVAKDNPAQRPTWWGLNLFGQGGLTRNPKFHINAPLPSLSLTTVDPSSAMGKRLSAFSTELWDEYRLASKEFEPIRLRQLLRRLLAPAELGVADRVAVVSGLIGSFSSVAAADGEMLAQHFCIATCLTTLLPWIDDPEVRALVRQQLQLDFDRTNNLLANLLMELRTNDGRLLAHNGLLSDIYYLPLRITRMLGLFGMLAIVGRILDFETEASQLLHREGVSTLISTYSKLLVALDDEQATPLYIFLKAAQLMGWTEEGKEVIQNLYFDAAIRGGIFNRLGSDGEGAFEHVLIVSKSELASNKRVPANPSSLLPVILLGGIWFQCAQDWDLKAFDRRNIGLFLPNDYKDFSEDVISTGITHTWQIGFGVWQIAEFGARFDDVLSQRKADSLLSPETHALCMLAAMLFPNRIPFSLEFLK